MISLFKNALSLLDKSEKQKLLFNTLFNALSSVLDITSLIVLLAVVGFYSHIDNKVSFLIFKNFNDTSILPIAFLLCLFLVKNFLGYTIFKSQSSFVYQVASRISKNQLLQYLDGNFQDYITINKSKQTNKINHEPIEYAHYVLFSIQQVFTEFFLSVLAIATILYFNALLFLILLTFFLPPVFLSLLFSRRKLKKVRQDVKSDAEMSNQYLTESLNSYIESSVYEKKFFFTERYSHFQNKLNQHLSELQIAQWIPSRLIEIFAVLGLFLLIALNHFFGFNTDLVSIGAFTAAAYKIIPGVVRIINLTSVIKTYEYTIKDLTPEKSSNQSQKLQLPSIQNICFADVSFSYQGKEIIKHLNFSIQSGDFVSIAGISGTGKTSVVNLILGFINPVSGNILFNETNTTANERVHFRQQFSYVKQQNFLIHDTILSNIILDDNSPDEGRLEEALHISGLSKTLLSGESGLNKIITENGKNLSGGQRQRIAIARAVYKNAANIILDEPFNELDETSERELLQHFKQMAEEGKIIILLSHSSLNQYYCNKTIIINE